MTDSKTCLLFESKEELEEGSFNKFIEKLAYKRKFEMKMSKNKRAAIVTFSAAVDIKHIEDRMKNCSMNTFTVDQLPWPINKIYVYDLPNVKPIERFLEHLELHFESERFCQFGGEVSSIKLHDCGHSAVVEFKDINVAERLFLEDQCRIENYEVRIKLLPPTPKSVNGVLACGPDHRVPPPKSVNGVLACGPDHRTNITDRRQSTSSDSQITTQASGIDFPDGNVSPSETKSSDSLWPGAVGDVGTVETQPPHEGQSSSCGTYRTGRMDHGETCRLMVDGDGGDGDEECTVSINSKEKFKLLQHIINNHYDVFSRGNIAGRNSFHFDKERSVVLIKSSNSIALQTAKKSLDTELAKDIHKTRVNIALSSDVGLEDWVTHTLLDARLPAVLCNDDAGLRLVSFSSSTSTKAAEAVSNGLLTGRVFNNAIARSRETFVKCTSGRKWDDFVHSKTRSHSVEIRRYDDGDHVTVYGLPRHVVKVVGEIENFLTGRR